MILDHKKSGEVGHIHDYASVKQYACLSCENTESSFQDGAPFCNRCNRYMLQSGFIQESKVIEIKNRKLNLTQGGQNTTKRGRKGRAEDGLIKKAVWGTVWPRGAGKELKLAVNMDDEMFIKGQVMIVWGDLRFMTSVDEIGAAFSPFDSTPITTLRENGVNLTTGEIMYEPLKIPVSVVRKTTKIGPVDVSGGASRYAFDKMFATFSWGKQSAKFCMADICQVLVPAL